jgi:RNA polymerase sigma-70 factor (ECF subfamily)
MISPEARGAWHELEARLRPYVTRRAASVADVDDILQNVFVRMHQGLSTLEDDERFGGWVYKIAEHAVIDAARSRARETLVTPDAVLDTIEAGEHDDGDQLRAGLTECVALFVARLPSPYREAVTLTELEGLTQKEAAEMLGISLSGMKSRVQRGREKIRAMFDECCRISVDCRGRVVACEPRALDEIPHDCRGAALSWSKRSGDR